MHTPFVGALWGGAVGQLSATRSRWLALTITDLRSPSTLFSGGVPDKIRKPVKYQFDGRTHPGIRFSAGASPAQEPPRSSGESQLVVPGSQPRSARIRRASPIWWVENCFLRSFHA